MKKNGAVSAHVKAQVRGCRAEALRFAPHLNKDVPELDPASCRIVFYEMFPDRTDEDKKIFDSIPMAEKVKRWVAPRNRRD